MKKHLRKQVLFQLNPPPAEEIHLRWMKSLRDEIPLRGNKGGDLISSAKQISSEPIFAKQIARISSCSARFHYELMSCISVLVRFKIEDLKGSGRESPPAAGAGGASAPRLTEEYSDETQVFLPAFRFRE